VKKQSTYCATGLVLFSAIFLATPSKPAAAQGCTGSLFQDFISGWSGDIPKLLTTVTDDVVYEDKTVGAVLHGKEELRKFAEGWFKAFPDLHFTLTSTLISGNRAALEWVGTGTQKGDMPGMAPASNKVSSVPGVSIAECADGKIKHNADYWDMATVMKQLGLLPPPTH
jgi:steroid delta-isomerase-like uncharacterized protein